MNYLRFFNISIPSYSFFIIIGLITANLFSYIIIEKKKLILDDFILIETFGLSFGMLGAKLLYFFVSRDEIDFSRILDWNYIRPYIEGGFVFYGGFILGLLGIYLVKIINKINVWKYISELIFFLPLVHGFGRIGCFFSGCCYGVPYNGPFSVEYKDIPYTLCNINLFPVQLIEAFCLLIIGFILFYFIVKDKASKNFPLYYCITYSFIRFILEFYRFDSKRGSLLFFSTSQWISVLIFIISTYFIIRNNNLVKYKKELTL